MKSLQIDVEAPFDPAFLAHLAAAEATGEMRVLRKLAAPLYAPLPCAPRLRLGICVDVEATGLDTAVDEVIEIALLPFSYDADDAVVAVHAPLVALREPTKPIPAAITALTGIDSAMVAGRILPLDEVEAFVAPAAILVAHNCAYDRRMLERISAVFASKPWACTVEDAAWAEEDIPSAKLDYVAMRFGFFQGSERHRALDDCLAVVDILARQCPVSGGTVLSKVLSSARRGRRRVHAQAPFAVKDDLKRARYRWDAGGPGRTKGWYKDVIDGFAAASEHAFLAALKPACRGREEQLTAYDRFSIRA